jgi:hydrogenase/urease accessory protein HupE
LRRAAWIAALLVFAGLAAAHEVRPAYLRIAELSLSGGPDRYEFLWRVPADGEIPLTIHVVLPDECHLYGNSMVWMDAGVRIEKWTSTCSGGLNGRAIAIGDLKSSVTDVLVRYERLDGTAQIVRLTPTTPDFVVTSSESITQVARTYTQLGIEHILLGIDHLLFVLALLLIVDGRRRLVVTITSFTIAHSMTLAAATLGFVRVPQAPVEAVIALSILFVAIEIVHWQQGRPGITRRSPWIVAFAFGLLHGLGFAGALSSIGLPDHAIPVALLFFNIGVEAGQLLFIAAVLVLWFVTRRIGWPNWAWRLPVYAIGSMAAFWTIERVASFAV